MIDNREHGRSKKNREDKKNVTKISGNLFLKTILSIENNGKVF